MVDQPAQPIAPAALPCLSTAVRTPFFPTSALGGGLAAGVMAGALPVQPLLCWQPTCVFETGWFLTMGVADMVLTSMLLNTGMVDEVNPMARFFLFSGGLHGLVGYKCATLVVASVCAQLITLRRPRTAKAVLHTGIWVQLLVVAYSVVLLTLVDD